MYGHHESNHEVMGFQNPSFWHIHCANKKPFAVLRLECHFCGTLACHMYGTIV
jgi:hypothetical protein